MSQLVLVEQTPQRILVDELTKEHGEDERRVELVVPRSVRNPLAQPGAQCLTPAGRDTEEASRTRPFASRCLHVAEGLEASELQVDLAPRDVPEA